MIRLLADNNVDGHLGILVRFFLSDEWIGFWNDLELTTVTFEDLGIKRDADDIDLWRDCQREQVVLITSNRNADGPKSLQATLGRENTSDSLPVFTLADPDRISLDRVYAERTALSLLEYLTRLDEIRGTGRIFIP
jgi:hypothetical protein